MGQVLERAWARRRVKFDNSTQSDPIDIRGFQEFFLEIDTELQGETIEVSIEVSPGVFAPVLDAAGAKYTIATTTIGLVPLANLPTWLPIRFQAGNALTTEVTLDCKS